MWLREPIVFVQLVVILAIVHVVWIILVDVVSVCHWDRSSLGLKNCLVFHCLWCLNLGEFSNAPQCMTSYPAPKNIVSAWSTSIPDSELVLCSGKG